MITNSLFTFACAGLIGMLFGTLLAFGGYKLFVILLPVWGFFFGFTLGAQSVQALFGTELLASVTSWVVGFFVGGLFAVMSYAFYIAAVAVVGFSVGYFVPTAILTAIGMRFGLVLWIIAILAGLAMAFITIRYNLQKWVVIGGTGLMGAATIFGTIVLMFNPLVSVFENPVRMFFNDYPILAICAIVIAVLGIIFQVQTTKSLEVQAYNRFIDSGVY